MSDKKLWPFEVSFFVIGFASDERNRTSCHFRIAV